MMNFILKKDNRDSREKDRDQLLKNIAIAHREWKDKENYFEAVIDPDLVDYSIYEIEASRRKYLYLLRQMRDTYETSKPNELGDSSLTHG